MVLSATLFKSPGSLNHQTKVAADAMQHSTYIPAAPINAMPFVGQHPGIGHIAIQARRENEKHDAELVTFAAEMFARKAVPEFVQNFREDHGQAEHPPIFWSEKLMEAGQLRRRCRIVPTPGRARTLTGTDKRRRPSC